MRKSPCKECDALPIDPPTMNLLQITTHSAQPAHSTPKTRKRVESQCVGLLFLISGPILTSTKIKTKSHLNYFMIYSTMYLPAERSNTLRQDQQWVLMGKSKSVIVDMKKHGALPGTTNKPPKKSIISGQPCMLRRCISSMRVCSH